MQWVVAALMLVVFSTNASAQATLRERLAGPQVAGHRGTGEGPDGNTLEGFAKAFADGAQIIETDLQVTRDGVAVLSHDAKIRPAGGGAKRVISEMSLSELKACRVGGTYSVPTFEELLQWSAGKVVINAEFKDKASIAPALALVKTYDAYEWVYFQTQDDPNRYRMARAADSKAALLFKVIDAVSLNWALDQKDDQLLVLALDGRMRTPAIIERIHAAGKLVSEDASDFGLFGERMGQQCDKVFSAGVDIAVTDHVCDCIKAAASVHIAGPPSSLELLTARWTPIFVCAAISMIMLCMLASRFRELSVPARLPQG